MSTYSPLFSAITREFPQEEAAIARLAELSEQPKKLEMTIDHLVLQTSAKSFLALLKILERLVSSGTAERVYRVESPESHAPIQDFSSFRNVPERIHDWHRGEELAVTPRNVRLLYFLGGKGTDERAVSR
jgi:hypothetical protein